MHRLRVGSFHRRRLVGTDEVYLGILFLPFFITLSKRGFYVSENVFCSH